MDFKFSIVIPAYNIEKYISVMIESIINQSYTNWELIIIDDGSTDNTFDICNQYLSDKIFVYHINNIGQIAARIEGVKKCVGDYVLVVDSDDYLVSNCLYEVNKVLNIKDYDCVIFPFDCCDENLNYVWTTKAPNHIGELSQEEVIIWVVELMNHNLMNKVFKTEIIKKGIEEALIDKVSINGDYALIVPIMCFAETSYYLDKPLYKYRVFGESISHKRKFQHILDTDLVTDSVVSILKKHNLFNDEIEKSVVFSYFYMITWFMREICDIRFVTKDELSKLQGSNFFRNSKQYEKKGFVPKNLILEMNIIRKKGYISICIINLFYKFLNIYHKLVGEKE